MPPIAIVECGQKKHLDRANLRVKHRPRHDIRKYVEKPPR